MNVPKKKALSIQKEFSTTGHRPLLVLTEDFESYVVKNGKGKKVPTEILNEFLCAQFLKLWQLPCPDHAIIEVDPELIKFASSLQYQKPFYFESKCFGSKYIENTDDLNSLTLRTKTKRDYNKINNPNEVLRIALFDIWVDNVDRHNGNYNLLQQYENEGLKYIPIDHAFVFDQLNYSELNANRFNPSSNMHLLDSGLGIFIKTHITRHQTFFKEEKDYLYLCVEECKSNITSIENFLLEEFKLPSDTFIPIKNYLFDEKRIGRVFEEFQYRMLL